MSRKPALRLLWALLALVLAAAAAVAGISAYAASSMTQAKRTPPAESPTDYGLEYQDVSFPSRDGLTLRGWWLPGGENSGRVIIMVHGADTNRADPWARMPEIAGRLVANGDNVLMFDLRGHGESDGSRITAGDHERKDLLGAVDYARQRGIERIGVIGFSLGAVTALMTAAECPEIGAVVADSAYADLPDIMRIEFAKRSDLPGFFLPAILLGARLMYGADFNAVVPAEVLGEAACPVFIIQGGRDDTVPTGHAYRLAEASANPLSRLWVVPEAEHTGIYRLYPDEYLARVSAFFGEALGDA